MFDFYLTILHVTLVSGLILFSVIVLRNSKRNE